MTPSKQLILIHLLMLIIVQLGSWPPFRDTSLRWRPLAAPQVILVAAVNFCFLEEQEQAWKFGLSQVSSKWNLASETYLLYGYTAGMAIWFIFVSQIIYCFWQIWQLVFQRHIRIQMSHWKQSCTSMMVLQDSESDNQRRSLLKHLQSAGLCLSLPSLFLSYTSPVEDTVLSAATILLLLGALMAW